MFSRAFDLIGKKSFVLLIVILLHGSVTFLTGPVLTKDSLRYSLWADALIDSGFDYDSLPYTRGSAVIFRLAFVTLVALTKLVFGAHWPGAVLGINILSEAGTAVLLVDVVLRTTRRKSAGWLALAFYLAAFDIFYWIRFAISDSTFLWLSFFVFTRLVSLASGLVGTTGMAARRKSWTIVAGLVIVCLVYRPTGIVLVPIAVWAALLLRNLRKPGDLAHRLRVGAATYVIGALLPMLAVLHFAQHPERWPVDAFSKLVKKQSARFARGEVVDSRPETFRPGRRSFSNYAAISAERFARFFFFANADFSLRHVLYNAGFFLPLYVLGLCAVPGLFSRDGEPLTKVVGVLSLLTVFTFAVFHAVTLLDAIWRYRLPVMPHFILLAAIGTNSCGKWFDQRLRSRVSRSGK